MLPAIVYLMAISGGFLLTLILVPAVQVLAVKWQAIDRPQTAERKIHGSPVPLLGGLAIFAAFFVVVFLFRYFHLANFSKIPDRYLLGIFVGAIFIMIGGFLDDKYSLKPWQQVIWPILAALSVVISGIKIGYVTNLIGGPQNALVYLWPSLGVILTFVWLLGLMYTTKFLDGLDGLVSGITVIAGVIIFLLSLDWDVRLSATSVMALIIAGSSLGFLIFNWHPAKIFLGEGGSVFVGFILGILSIVSGSKIATTLLVIGIPVLDVLWVIIQRLIHRESPFSHADNKHLHYRLLSFGLSHREAVMFLYLISLAFGVWAIISHGVTKLIGLIAIIILMIALILAFYFRSRKRPGLTAVDK